MCVRVNLCVVWHVFMLCVCVVCGEWSFEYVCMNVFVVCAEYMCAYIVQCGCEVCGERD